MAWCGAVSNSIVYGDKNYICQQKKKKKDKIPLNDKKPFKMGKLSWVACHRLLPGSVPARGVFMHNRGAAFAVLMAKKTP